MLTLKANKPIGIFDSGIGGLTVTRAVIDQLPNESIVYFGDTAHLPYGDKSIQTVQNYTKKIVDFLLMREVKLILIACNAASSAAYEMLKNYVGNRAILLNVIDPVVNFLGTNYANKRIGLIGTKLTLQTQVYHQKIAKLAQQIDFCALATPLLVPIIEEGFFEHELIDVALAEYLAHPTLQNIDALVLGCTHYPVIKKSIAAFYKNKIDIVDAAKIVAKEVDVALTSHGILSSAQPNHHFYVSDYTESFAKGTRLFFGKEIKVEAIDIF
ncbi:MAG: glutamate racemase [bacterium]